MCTYKTGADSCYYIRIEFWIEKECWILLYSVFFPTQIIESYYSFLANCPPSAK